MYGGMRVNVQVENKLYSVSQCDVEPTLSLHRRGDPINIDWNEMNNYLKVYFSHIKYTKRFLLDLVSESCTLFIRTMYLN